MAERQARVNKDSTIATVLYSRREPWKSTISLWLVPGREASEPRFKRQSLESAPRSLKSWKWIGGTAINTGTIPSKTIREAVLHLSGYQYQSIYGVNYRVKEQITMADLSFRALNVIKTEIDVIRAQLSRNGIEVVTGTASFLDPHHMQSDEFARTSRV